MSFSSKIPSLDSPKVTLAKELEDVEKGLKETAKNLYTYILTTGTLGLNAHLQKYHYLAYEKGEEADKKSRKTCTFFEIQRKIQFLERTLENIRKNHFPTSANTLERISKYAFSWFSSAENSNLQTWYRIEKKFSHLQAFFLEVASIENPSSSSTLSDIASSFLSLFQRSSE